MQKGKRIPNLVYPGLRYAHKSLFFARTFFGKNLS